MHEVHLVRSFGALSHPNDYVNNRCGASIHGIKPRVYPWKRSTTRGFQRPDPFTGAVRVAWHFFQCTEPELSASRECSSSRLWACRQQ